jgi:manganese/iron transport system substrate-binding protein
MTTRYRILVAVVLTALLTSLAACAGAPTPSGSVASDAENAPAASERLKVVATTTIVGDVVRQVAGDAVDLTVLLPAGADPHGFQPTPRDAALIANADLIFINGLDLEEFLDRLIQNAGGNARVVAVSDGVMTIEGHHEHEHEGEDHDHEHEGEDHGHEHEGEDHDHEHEGEDHGHEHEDEDHDHEHEGEDHDHEHGHEGADPHVWMDPNNVRVWTRNIAAALSDLDPANAAAYQANAERYDQALQALDAWVKEQIARIAPENRQMVVDHDAFGYFARRYGFETVGTVVPGYSTMSAPSAQELARLQDAIRALGVRAVFVGSTVNPALAQRVAADTGTQLVFLFTGSLSEPGGGAETYEDFVRYNVNAIVDALR